MNREYEMKVQSPILSLEILTYTADTLLTFI